MHYRCYETNTGLAWRQLSDFSTLTTAEEGYNDYFNINTVDRSDNYGYLFETMIDLPNNGTYTFYLFSDDGSKLFIDGNCIVNNDVEHPMKWVPEENNNVLIAPSAENTWIRVCIH